MWFLVGGGVTVALVLIAVLRRRGDGSDMGTVSDDWLARQRASRRLEP